MRIYIPQQLISFKFIFSILKLTSIKLRETKTEGKIDDQCQPCSPAHPIPPLPQFCLDHQNKPNELDCCYLCARDYSRTLQAVAHKPRAAG